MGIININKTPAVEIVEVFYDEIYERFGHILGLHDHTPDSEDFAGILLIMITVLKVHGSDYDVATLSTFLKHHPKLGPKGE